MVVERVYLDDKSLKPQTIAHHRARYEFAGKFRKFRRGDTALDLACGSGYGTDMLRQFGYEAIGVDIDRYAIDYAKEHYPLNKYVVCDLAEYNPPRFSFDLAVMFEAIEHVRYSDGLKILEKVRDNMRSGGVFMLSTPRDIKGKYNHLHKSQWDYPVLKNTLGSIFEIVNIYGQNWDDASISEDDVINNDFYIAVCQ